MAVHLLAQVGGNSPDPVARFLGACGIAVALGSLIWNVLAWRSANVTRMAIKLAFGVFDSRTGTRQGINATVINKTNRPVKIVGFGVRRAHGKRFHRTTFGYEEGAEPDGPPGLEQPPWTVSPKERKVFFFDLEDNRPALPYSGGPIGAVATYFMSGGAVITATSDVGHKFRSKPQRLHRRFEFK